MKLIQWSEWQAVSLCSCLKSKNKRTNAGMRYDPFSLNWDISTQKNKYVNVKFSFSTIFRIIRFSIRKRKYVKLTIAHRQTSVPFSKWGQIQAYWSHQNVKCFLKWTDNTVKSSTIRIWDICILHMDRSIRYAFKWGKAQRETEKRLPEQWTEPFFLFFLFFVHIISYLRRIRWGNIQHQIQMTLSLLKHSLFKYAIHICILHEKPRIKRFSYPIHQHINNNNNMAVAHFTRLLLLSRIQYSEYR